MRPAVYDVFPVFTARFEGRTPYLYLDINGNVTVGLGCLVQSLAQCQTFPWGNALGEPATAAEVESAWDAVRAATDLEPRGGGSFSALTMIRLTEEAIDDLARKRAAINEIEMMIRFPLADLQADAQLGLQSMAWAMGADGFRNFPRFSAAILARDWATAAIECRINDRHNPGLRPRNAANARLFGACLDPGDPDVLRGWP